MQTKITFTSVNRYIFEKKMDGGKIKVIKCFRDAFGIGLQVSKQVIDALWEDQVYTSPALPRAKREGQDQLHEYGIHIVQPDAHIPLDTRLMQLVKAALKHHEFHLALNLLSVHNDHFGE
jgi:hypothetical protein